MKILKPFLLIWVLGIATSILAQTVDVPGDRTVEGTITANQFVGPVVGTVDGAVGSIAPSTGVFTTLQATGAVTFTGSTIMLAPLLSDITGATQCLHVNPSGQISGFGSDCGSGGGGGSGGGSYIAAFGSATTVTVTGATHQLGTKGILVACFDNATPPNFLEVGSYTVDSSTFDVVIHFLSAETGYCALSAGGAANGVTGSSLTNNAAVFGSGGSSLKVDGSLTSNGSGVLTGAGFVGPLTGAVNGTVGVTTPAAGHFTTLQATGATTIPAPVLSNVTGSTQCLHVNSSGQISGFGADCTAGASGNVTGSALTNNAVMLGSGASAIKADNSLTSNGSGTLTAVNFSGPLNGTVGATTPTTGVFTTLGSTGKASLNNLFVNGVATPSLQGAYLGWNRTAGGGETDFLNNQGGGAGGFNWYNAPSVGTPVTLIASLSGTGGLTTAGFTAAGSNPDFVYHNTSAPTDQKYWDMYADNTAGTLVGRTLNDAFSAGNAWMEVTRTGYVPTGFYLFEPTLSNSSFTAKSYNLVIQADQYCTTPGVLDGTCLTNAMAACPASGCSIQMPEGTITATTGQLPITVTKPIQFIGRSWEDSIITTSDTTKDIFYIPSIGDVIFRDFRITRTGTPSAGAGIEIGIGQHIVIDHMVIVNQYNNVNISGNAFWDKIDNSIFSGAINDGIASQCQGLMMTDNVIIYNAGNGLEISGQGSCGECKGNSYYANKGYGIWYHLSTPTQTSHVGDGVDSSGNVGVRVQGVNGFTFANGFVYSSGTGFSGINPINTFINVPGLVVDDTDTQTIIINGNTFSNNGGDGFQCSGCPQAVISNNLTFINNQANAGGAGIRIANSGVAWGNLTVTGNNAPDVRSGTAGVRQAYGLAISGGSGGTISGSGNSWAGALGAFNAGTISAAQSWAGNYPTNLDNNIILSGAPAGACRSGTIYTRSDATGGLYICVNTAWSQVTIP